MQRLTGLLCCYRKIKHAEVRSRKAGFLLHFIHSDGKHTELCLLKPSSLLLAENLDLTFKIVTMLKTGTQNMPFVLKAIEDFKKENE